MSKIHNKKAAEIIKKIIYITLATVTKDGQPWNSPLFSMYDKELNFYWSSDWKSVHSGNIRANNKVFCVIYDSTMKEGTGEGVYFAGKSYELTDEDDILNALRIMDKRVGKAKVRNAKTYLGKNPLRLNRVVPEKLWMNDVELDKNGKYIKDVKIEIPIGELKELIK